MAKGSWLLVLSGGWWCSGAWPSRLLGLSYEALFLCLDTSAIYLPAVYNGAGGEAFWRWTSKKEAMYYLH